MDVARTQYSIGILKYQQEQYDEAIPYFKESSELCRRLAQTDSNQQKWHILSLYWLSRLYLHNKDLTSAYQINKELLPLLEDCYVSSGEAYKNEFISILGNQSYYALLTGQYVEAERLARKIMDVDPSLYWSNSYLAPALLFQGKYKEAEKKYLKYKDELRDDFLDDFKRLSEAGVIPKEYEAAVERIKTLLNE